VRKNPLDMGLRTKKYNIKIKWRRNKTDRKKALSNREISDTGCLKIASTKKYW
jgi:hypothetical protein